MKRDPKLIMKPVWTSQGLSVQVTLVTLINMMIVDATMKFKPVKLMVQNKGDELWMTLFFLCICTSKMKIQTTKEDVMLIPHPMFSHATIILMSEALR